MRGKRVVEGMAGALLTGVMMVGVVGCQQAPPAARRP